MPRLQLICAYCRLIKQLKHNTGQKLLVERAWQAGPSRTITTGSFQLCKERQNKGRDLDENEAKKEGTSVKGSRLEDVAREKNMSSTSSDSSSSSESDSEGSSSDSDMEALDPKLVSAVKEVAEHMPGNKKEAETKILGQLLSQYKTTSSQKNGQTPRKSKEACKTNILEGMQFDLGQSQKKVVRGQRKEAKLSSIDDEDPESGENTKEVFVIEPFSTATCGTVLQPGIGLFSGKPLGIFKKADSKTVTSGKRSLLDIVAEERRREMEQFPPQNGFEEMIRWTQEGKMWTFPINNEAGWEEEKTVKFHEHVLLENQIRDFPRKGPIRHFMELVTVTLSKNPHLTVQQKHEHIDWFRNYFNEKSDILEAKLGADGIIKRSDKIAGSPDKGV
ncbi:28S ribosomal protein S31, mitochondrial-like [Mya arenaria]|uniref:28S ribosomal protein S31, mitochondrial-like n=1 Tax=Mya arenaria TaxID=6604 RepID=UPI0022E444B9|nr:28S ribosomal protein S31, mitochondrial-like [Mya arenaria]